jgi:hypothetical protein|nr:MAG TPA: hypothetical protein [Caudoviricetes sp.]
MEGIHSSPVQGEAKQTRQFYIDNMQLGNVVAFTISKDGHQTMLSGRVRSITPEAVTVQTKNGSIFYPKKDQVVWVRTGTRWPLGIYNALKFGKKGI